MAKTEDQVALNQWHVVACAEDSSLAKPRHTRLLGQDILVQHHSDTEIEVWELDGDVRASILPVKLRYGHVWTTLGEPEKDIFEMGAFRDPGRRQIYVGSVSVKTSALRVVENFLDMAHFPFVHTDVLGAEPNTEVVKYSAEERDGEVWAIDCRFHQPKAAANASGGSEINYTYRVATPFSAVLYKTSPEHPEQDDVISILIQPKAEDECDAFTLLCIYDDVNSDASLRQFQQTIFLQDLGILNNQVPARLPLDSGVEMPAGADRSSMLYRRWLKKSGLTFGALTSQA